MKQAILSTRFLLYALLCAATVSLATVGYLILGQTSDRPSNLAATRALLTAGGTYESTGRFVTNIVQTTLKDLQDTTLRDLDTPIIKARNNEETTIKFDKLEVNYPRGAQRIGSSFRDVIGFTGGLRGQPHRGIDIGERRGVPVLAAADGEAYAFFDPNSNPGNMITIRHLMPSRYVEVLRKFNMTRPFKIETRYLHLDQILIPDKSTNVKRGQIIGTVGNTGKYGSEVPHLHFEVRASYREGGIHELYGSLNPHYFWADGIGKITCYDPNAKYPTDITLLTWPLRCKQP